MTASDDMETPKHPAHIEPFPEADKRELLAIINQMRASGIKLNFVAAQTAINYKAFMNKVKDLELRLAGQPSTLKNSFTVKNYQIIRHWWAEFRQKMSAS